MPCTIPIMWRQFVQYSTLDFLVVLKKNTTPHDFIVYRKCFVSWIPGSIKHVRDNPCDILLNTNSVATHAKWAIDQRFAEHSPPSYSSIRTMGGEVILPRSKLDEKRVLGRTGDLWKEGGRCDHLNVNVYIFTQRSLEDPSSTKQNAKLNKNKQHQVTSWWWAAS